jgi:ribosome biogenesis GTPase
MRRRALVVSVGKNAAWIAVDGEPQPRIAELRRTRGKRSMPVPGDMVDVRILQDRRAVVDRIHERSLTLARRTPNGRAKTMAANVDTLAVVTALADPPPRLVTLDQVLAFAELESLGALVLFTKPDLADRAEREGLCNLYRGLGYETLVLNPKTGENVGALAALLRERRALLVGNSGVGKSTIFRALGGSAAVAGVSRFGLGRQTTTAARLYRVGGGFLIDSPGINEFGLGATQPRELAALFREMREPATRCRFRDCTHLTEPGCGVAQALAQGAIAASRCASFRSIASSSNRLK